MNNSASAIRLGRVAPLDPHSFVPLYMQLAESLSSLIEHAGESAVGKMLPSESDCVQHFGVSRPTVRQAMHHLTSSGLVVRQKGRGTFVAPRLRHEMTHGFEEEMKAAQHEVELKLLAWQRVRAPEAVRAALQLAASGKVWRLRRLRKVDGVAVGIEERHFPLALGERISPRDVKFEPMLTLLKKATGRGMARLHVEVASGLADTRLAHALGVKSGAPVLTKSLTYLFDSRPLAYGCTTFLSEYYRFRFSVDLPI
jgi:GntR family transcriptional regulator